MNAGKVRSMCLIMLTFFEKENADVDPAKKAILCTGSASPYFLASFFDRDDGPSVETIIDFIRNLPPVTKDEFDRRIQALAPFP